MAPTARRRLARTCARQRFCLGCRFTHARQPADQELDDDGDDDDDGGGGSDGGGGGDGRGGGGGFVPSSCTSKDDC